MELYHDLCHLASPVLLQGAQQCQALTAGRESGIALECRAAVSSDSWNYAATITGGSSSTYLCHCLPPPPRDSPFFHGGSSRARLWPQVAAGLQLCSPGCQEASYSPSLPFWGRGEEFPPRLQSQGIFQKAQNEQDIKQGTGIASYRGDTINTVKRAIIHG